ncbi:MAG: 5-deoxy-glucuronate isomerase [Ktedonobacteraceae bacterium]
MRQYDASNLIIHAGNASEPDVVVAVTPEQAGWNYISFQVRRLAAQQAWAFSTGEYEMVIVLLSGRLSVESNRGRWQPLGTRKDVFSQLPYALYLPRHTSFTVHADITSEFAAALAPTEQDHEPQLITPRDIEVEIRGGDNATRHINSIIPAGFPCQRLVVVEVYTPGGNWSSYPPHKHDIHKTHTDGNLEEADLEEVYFYKLSSPEGYAFQRVYTAPESPLQQAGFPIDALVLARDNDIVLIPEGYHPVTSAPGYTTYYLNVLAGSAQTLQASDDPNYAWIKQSYTARDPRVPVYDVSVAHSIV